MHCGFCQDHLKMLSVKRTVAEPRRTNDTVPTPCRSGSVFCHTKGQHTSTRSSLVPNRSQTKGQHNPKETDSEEESDGRQANTLRKNEILKPILNKAWRAQTQREQASKSRRKLTLKLQGSGGGSEPDPLRAYQPVCSPASELSGSFSGSHS